MECFYDGRYTEIRVIYYGCMTPYDLLGNSFNLNTGAMTVSDFTFSGQCIRSTSFCILCIIITDSLTQLWYVWRPFFKQDRFLARFIVNYELKDRY